VKRISFHTLPNQLRYSLTIQIYNSLSKQRLENPSLNQRISLPALNAGRLGLTYEPASESDAIALQNAIDSDIETLPAYLFNFKALLKLHLLLLKRSANNSIWLSLLIHQSACP
jgi:hypothetical protein